MLANVVILGLLVVVGYWILHPLIRPRVSDALALEESEERAVALRQRKEDIYAAIKEMDFDFEMGKISEEDHEDLKSQYKARAIEILKELDTKEEVDEVDDSIEEEVRRLREKRKEEGKKEKRADSEGTGKINFCPECGSKAAPDSKFCRDCGVQLGSPKGEN